MSIPSDAIISKWNKSFRGWSENYIKPYKSAILRACLFRDRELQKGHSSALKDIEKNKGDIRSFVMENTEQKYSSLLPSKILQDSYSFNHDEYRMVYRSCLNNFICWKPGTSNALSKSPLEIVYGSNSNNEHFKCKFRKYQLESMKKFIQATPGTKEIRGQWSVNLADDSMMITFGQQQDIVIIIKIGCFKDKLQIMYQENGILRKNSKIRKQTLKTSCWGLEKTKNSPKFENSIIIQENYSIDINADNVLSISPIKVYVKKTASTLNRLKIFCGDVCQVINLQKRPYHIQSIQYPQLTHDDEQHLRLKYRNNLLNHSKTKSGTTVSKPTPIKSEPTSSSTSTRSSRPRSSRPQSSRSSNNAPPAVTIDDDGDQDVDAQGWNPTKPKRNHSQQIIDDDTVNDDDNNDEDDDHGFNPTKPNPQQYRNRIQSSLNRINRIIPSGAISIASLEDTVVTTTNQEPISSTRNINNYQSMDPYSTPMSTSTYTPQQPQPQPPSVNGYRSHNIIQHGPTQFRLNDTDTFVVENTMTQFDPTQHGQGHNNINTPIIDDTINWPTFDGLNRMQSITNEHFPMSFDHVFTAPMNDDNTYPPITMDHNNTNNYNQQQFHPQFTTDTNNNHNHNNPQGPIISDITNTPQDINISEMQELRLQNERLLQRVAEQQRQIEFLAQQIGTMHSQNVSYPATINDYDYDNTNEYEQFDQFQQFNEYQQRHHHQQRRNNPLRKRRRISSEALLPPAA